MSDQFISRKFSRRDFLRTASTTGAVAATAGLMAVPNRLAAAAVPSSQVTFDREVDVIVVGSGSGQVAAIKAAEDGLEAIVLEKAANVGGTTGISGGGIWVPNNFAMAAAGIEDSREEAIEYLSHATFGQGTPELQEAYVDNCNQMVDYLRSVGIDWVLAPWFNDYYPEFPGGKPLGRHIDPVSTIEGASGGGALAQMLHRAGEERGVEYLLETPAKRLIVNDDGAVVGVVAESGGAEINIKARRGVVIASGGFDHNPEMVTNFLRGPIYYPSAVSTNTGDGHLMGMALGANLRNMNEIWGWPMYFNEEYGIGIPALAYEIGKPGTIVVNKAGERFMNEAGAYDPATRTFYTYDNGTHTYPNIPGFVITDSENRARYTLAYTQPGVEPGDWIVKADTLEELAAALEIDAETLLATVERFNEFAAQGLDPDYHRGESDFDKQTGGDTSRDDIANPCLAPVATAPFYATRLYPGALGTCGGLQTNTLAQVLDVWGNPIPRLYAIGNASGSAMGAGYPGGGATVGAGMTFGFIAAQDMESLESL